ncbi:hypothetical protein ACFLXA_05445 [Chloroflexota bacterium]
MFQAIAIIFSIAAIIVCFFSRMGSWIILAVAFVLMLWQLYGAKVKYSAAPQPELSARANELFKRYTAYYVVPFACVDFNKAAMVLAVAGVVVTAIGLFYSFYWGILFGVINLISEIYISRVFTPESFIRRKSYQSEHEEIISFLREKAEQECQDFTKKT